MAQRDQFIDFEVALTVTVEAPRLLVTDLEDGSNIYAADFGEAFGVSYQVNEELRIFDKEHERDLHRWELNPASAEDYRDRMHGLLRGSE